MNLVGGRLHPGLVSVLDTALDAVCVMDRTGTVAGWNRHAATLFGWSREEAIGRRLSDLIIPPALRDKHERGLAHFLATGEGPVLNRRIEVSSMTANGEEVPVELSITPTDQFGDLLFIGFVRDISDRQAAIERHQRLLQESDHRVKNMLTVVAAIARQTARTAESMDEFIASFSDRLDSLARAHSLLTGRTWHDLSLAAIAEQVLAADVRAGRARFGGPEVLLPATHVLGLSMILHELYTNAIKYGALCTDEGSVDMSWGVDGGEARLVWTEIGPACPPSEPRSGFGQRMIEMVAKSDLGGSVERSWNDNGLTVTIRFPIDK